MLWRINYKAALYMKKILGINRNTIIKAGSNESYVRSTFVLGLLNKCFDLYVMAIQGAKWLISIIDFSVSGKKDLKY